MALIHLMDGHVEALSVRVHGVPLHITSSFPAALNVDITADPAVLSVDLHCDAQYPQGSAVDEYEVKTLLERDILSLLTRLQEMRCDCLGFGELAVRHFLTIQAWEAFNWRGVYAAARVQVQITVQCRGS